MPLLPPWPPRKPLIVGAEHEPPVDEVKREYNERDNDVTRGQHDLLGHRRTRPHDGVRREASPSPAGAVEGTNLRQLRLLQRRDVHQVLHDHVRHDDEEEQEDAEEEPDVDQLDVGGDGEGVGGVAEEGVQHEERRQRHRHAHLRSWPSLGLDVVEWRGTISLSSYE